MQLLHVLGHRDPLWLMSECSSNGCLNVWLTTKPQLILNHRVKTARLMTETLFR